VSDRHLAASYSMERHGRARAEMIDTLYASCAERLYRFVMARTRDSALAEDVVSETFLRAVREIDRLPTAEPACVAWLYRTAGNLVIDDYRRRKREAEASRAAAELRAPTEDERTRTDLWAAVDGLPQAQRTAVTLRYAHGMKLTDIADAMSRSEGSVKQLLLRALRTLRKRVGE
jgi:RNA polymerase sigma-70 factor (ECF subfamily)